MGLDPLYLFDPAFDTADAEMLSRYDVPEGFCGQDLMFSLLSKEDCPDYRWLLVGPEFSGSHWHVDPLGSAWNGLMEGTKRWVVAEPEISRALLQQTLQHPVARVTPMSKSRHNTGHSLRSWFEYDWPAWRDTMQAEGREWYEFEQNEGDIVYVPQGWGHAALNLETHTVAVTQNLVTVHDLEECLETTAEMYPDLHAKWQCALLACRPTFRSVAQDAADGTKTE